MRLFRILFALTLLGTVVHTPVAFAKKEASASAAPAEIVPIANVGIPEMDGVFTKARAIQDKLVGSNANIANARTELNNALMVATDAPLATALKSLKEKAADQIKVAMDGGKIKLQPADAAPDNVKAGAAAVNKMIDALTAAAADGVGMVPDAKALGVEAGGFPMKVPTMKVEGVDMMAAAKQVGINVKAIKALPNQIDSLAAQLGAATNDIKVAFGG